MLLHTQVTIPEGSNGPPLVESISGVVDISQRVLTSIHMSAAWTAASITFLASSDGLAPWLPVYDAEGDEFEVTTGPGRVVTIEPDATRGLRYLRLRSGTAGSGVHQAAERHLSVGLVEDNRS